MFKYQLVEDILSVPHDVSFQDHMQYLGYTVLVHRVQSKRNIYCYYLSNTFYEVVKSGQVFLVDMNFRETFRIVRPSEAYEHVYNTIPHVFAGTLEELHVLTYQICKLMAYSFRQMKLSLPPWRRFDSIITKWRLID